MIGMVLTFLRSLVKLAVGLHVEVDINELRASQELENHARRDNGRNAQLHERSSVRGKHHTQPVQRIGAVRGNDAVKRHLTHHEEDEKRDLSRECQWVLHAVEVSRVCIESRGCEGCLRQSTSASAGRESW